MTKVIHVITDSNIGGAGRVLLQYLSNYNRKRYNIRVALPKNSLLLPEIKKRNVPHIELPHISDSSFSPKAILMFKKLFEDEKPDIVHTHASLSARIGARMANKTIKIVHTRHTVSKVSEKDKTPWKRNINHFINKKYSDVIIAVSPAAKENMVLEGTDENQIKVVMNGISPVQKMNEQEIAYYKAELEIDEKYFLCALIARFEHIKGHEYMLDAAKLLQDKGENDILFLIAGTGELQSEIIRRAKNMKLENVKFLGFVSEIDKLENIMNIQMNTSFFEGTSISLLEGMSLGKPAVATNAGGNPYVILDRENGIIIPVKNSLALAEAIVELRYDTKLYNELSEGAIQVFNREFTVIQMVRNMEEIYRQLLSSH